MTTLERPADWKVTVGYRLLLRVGWGLFALAAYEGVVALVLGVPGAWWMAAGLAVAALLLVAFLPEPVPAGMLTDRRTWVNAKRPVE